MNTHKRVAIALLGGLAIAGIAGASAASLGGLNEKSLGSDDAVVASCDTDGIDVAYTTSYNNTLNTYVVTSVNLTGVATGCANQIATVTLSDGNLDSLFTSGNTTVSGTSLSIPVSPGVSASSVYGVSVVISG